MPVTESIAKKSANPFGESLVAYSQQLLAPAPIAVSDGSGGMTFVGFADPQGKNYDKLVAAGIRNGDAYLSEKGVLTKLNPLQFHVLQAEQFWVTFAKDKSGKITGVSKQDPGSWKSDWKESNEAAIIVYVDGRLVPANVSFRSTRANPGSVAAKELNYAAGVTPEGKKAWALQSKDHAAVAGKLAAPFSRFSVLVHNEQITAKTSGNKLLIPKGEVVLTSPAQAEGLAAAFADPKFSEAVAKVLDTYNSRVKELAAQIGGGK